jgi:hypothetical protein
LNQNYTGAVSKKKPASFLLSTAKKSMWSNWGRSRHTGIHQTKWWVQVLSPVQETYSNWFSFSWGFPF